MSQSKTKTTVIDAALMERAIALRQEGLTMEAIGAKLGVKATAYLAKKVRETYGPDTLARPSTPAASAVVEQPARPARKPRARKAAPRTSGGAMSPDPAARKRPARRSKASA